MIRTYRHLRSAYRIVSDVLSIGPDSTNAKRALLDALVSRMECLHGFCASYSDFNDDGPVRFVDGVHVGSVSPAAYDAWRAGPVYSNPRSHPLTARIAAHEARLAVLHRRTLISDIDWEQFGLAEPLRRLGLGEMMCAWYRVDTGRAFVLELFRPLAAAPFTLDHFRLVRLVLKELRRHSVAGRFLHAPVEMVPAGLTLREQQVLDLLLKGFSAKEVGSRLGISSMTVSGYIKDLYRHFAVHSRSELLSQFIRR